MRNNNRDSKRYYAWMDKAQDDLNAASILRAHGGSMHIVAFHCHQSIEKALKGYLLYKTGNHYDGHNLSYLCKVAMRQDSNFREWLDESASLNSYYIRSRYPSDVAVPFSEERLRSAYIMAERMYRYISKEIYTD